MKKTLNKELIGQICYREFQGRDSPCEFCSNKIILEQKPAPHKCEYHNPIFDKTFAIVDRIIKWPDGRDVRFELAIDITDRKRSEQIAQASEEAGLPAGWIQLLETRQDVAEMLALDEHIDLIIPRGSNEFVRYIMNHTNVPVLGHADVGERRRRRGADQVVRQYPEHLAEPVDHLVQQGGNGLGGAVAVFTRRQRRPL